MTAPPALRPPAWADHIATIRGYASMLAPGPYYQPVRDALAALEAELKRLRDDPNRLDFTGAPPVFATDPRDAEIERLRGVVRTMDEALESTGHYMVMRHGGLHIAQERRSADADRFRAAREAARQTLDRDPTGDGT